MAVRYERLNSDVTAARNSAADALARADAAGTVAGEARDLALGKAGYREAGLYEVHFAFDSEELTDEGKSVLDQAASTIQEQPGVLVDIYGHTDPTGSDRYNFELGQRRAQAVLRYLVRTAPGQLSRFAVASLGKSESSGASTREDRARARKVVVSLVERVPLGAVQESTADAAQ